MCRNIKTLANFEPPATDDEIRASAQLSHELQRRGADLVVGCRRLEVRQRLDVSAHVDVS